MTAIPAVLVIVAMCSVLIGLVTLVRQRRAAAGPHQSVLYVGVLMVIAGLVCGCWSVHPLLHALLQ